MKRTLNTDDHHTSDGSLTASSAPPKKKQARTTAKPTKPQSSNHASAPQPSSWPAKFQRIERTHRALNIVYTFCSTRKQVATTLDMIKGAVEGHLGRALTIEEVAEVVAIRPSGMRFEWVDEASLLADCRGFEREVFDIPGQDTTTRATHSNASTQPGNLNGSKQPQRQRAKQNVKQALLFEFTDGEFKRLVENRKTGEPGKPERRLRNEELKMPVYSQKQILQAIQRRNEKFATAVENFLLSCANEAVDPELKLAEESAKHVPRLPEINSADDEDNGLPQVPDTIPKERKPINEIIEELKLLPWYSGQIVPDGHRVLEAQEAKLGHLNFLMSQDLVNALYNARDITAFYSHQAEAINALHDGYHVVVSTSTSSGKSLIYQLPVLYELEKDHSTRAMYIFPTKALAQDQKKSLQNMLAYIPGLEDIIVETFDGDTRFEDRNLIRELGRVIFTNPDMLHITILPNEEKWRFFFQNLRFVVVDELHYYNSTAGVHMAYIMRRLRRVCSSVGNNRVKFVSCSATVANPLEHFTTLFGLAAETVKLVDVDGSPCGKKEFVCWNTPYRDPGDPASGRGDMMYESAKLFCHLILRGVRTIAFCRIRAQCEHLLALVKRELGEMGRDDCGNLVMGYRGGYTAQERRLIEKEMFEGKLLGIVATTALELGVDIGSLDAVITCGFPYSISHLRQQSGRAGRRNKDSLSVLVGGPFPADQHFMQNPQELFTRPNEELCVDLTNVLVAEGHIQCAASEMPIFPETDVKFFGKDTIDLAQLCKDRLEVDDLGFYHTHARFRPTPSKYVNIRNIDADEDNIAIVDVTNNRNIVLEELERSRATFTVYDGGIFLHQGQKYLIRDFNPDKDMARVEKVNVDWTTVQRDFTDIDAVETEESRRLDLVSEEAYKSGPTAYNATSRTAKSHYDGCPTPDEACSVPVDALHKDLAETSKQTQPCSIASYRAPVRAYKGKIRITQTVFGFFKVSSKNVIVDAIPVSNPPVIRFSKGAWLDLPSHCLRILAAKSINMASAIHSASHALLALFPLFVSGVAAGDVRTECKVAVKELTALRQKQKSRASADKSSAAGESKTTANGPRRRRPARLTFYDTQGGGGGGAGLSVKAFEFMDFLLPRALGRVEECECADGCVECVCDERCKEGNEVRSKVGAVVIFRCLLGWTLDWENNPKLRAWEAVREVGGAMADAGSRTWELEMRENDTIVPAVEVPRARMNGDK